LYESCLLGLELMPPACFLDFSLVSCRVSAVRMTAAAEFPVCSAWRSMASARCCGILNVFLVDAVIVLCVGGTWGRGLRPPVPSRADLWASLKAQCPDKEPETRYVVKIHSLSRQSLTAESHKNTEQLHVSVSLLGVRRISHSVQEGSAPNSSTLLTHLVS